MTGDPIARNVAKLLEIFINWIRIECAQDIPLMSSKVYIEDHDNI